MSQDTTALTPWQIECENKIILHNMDNREAELLRRVYELAQALRSREHWAIDSYTSYLVDKAEQTIKSIQI